MRYRRLRTHVSDVAGHCSNWLALTARFIADDLVEIDPCPVDCGLYGHDLG